MNQTIVKIKDKEKKGNPTHRQMQIITKFFF